LIVDMDVDVNMIEIEIVIVIVIEIVIVIMIVILMIWYVYCTWYQVDITVLLLLGFPPELIENGPLLISHVHVQI
jgi:hypothetical protein